MVELPPGLQKKAPKLTQLYEIYNSSIKVNIIKGSNNITYQYVINIPGDINKIDLAHTEQIILNKIREYYNGGE